MITKIFNTLGFFSKEQVESKRKEWLEKGKEEAADDLATELFERGGFATLQLQPLKIPRIKFVQPNETLPVDRSKADEFGFFDVK